MLFDLRGRGRRRTVQMIYLGLALLMGVGLIGFGVGGGIGGGGILSSLSNNNESSGGASFSSQIKKYKQLTARQPSSLHAWEQLTLAQLHEAGGEAYATKTGLTSKGKTLFAETSQSWNRYLALNPPKPNVELAQEMVRIFDEEGLNQPAEAVKVMQIVLAGRPPNATLYASLAEYAYKAHNPRIGDLASEKAVALAPASQRTLLKKELAEIKKSPNGPSGETYTATSAGKTFKVKPGPNGTLTGTATGPAPSTTGTSSSGASTGGTPNAPTPPQTITPPQGASTTGAPSTTKK